MTEEEAKTKWCPFARDSETAGNRSQSDEPDRHAARFPCIASACMAWRGGETSEFKARAEAMYRRDGVRLSPKNSDVTGHCGLAGALQ